MSINRLVFAAVAVSISTIASDSLLEIKHITGGALRSDGKSVAGVMGKYEVPKGRYAIIKSAANDITYTNPTSLMGAQSGLEPSPFGQQQISIRRPDLPYTLPPGAVVTFPPSLSITDVGKRSAGPDLVVHEFASQTALEVRLAEMEKRKNELESEYLRLSNATNIVIMRQLLADHLTQDLEKIFGDKIAALELELRATNKKLEACLGKQETPSASNVIKE